MVELATALMVIQTISLTVGVIYYIINLQNSNRTQQLSLESLELTRKAQENALETRQAQMFMQIYNESHNDPAFIDALMRSREWKFNTYEEFLKQQENEEDRRALARLHLFFEGLGVLVKEGYVEIKLVALLMTGITRGWWERLYKPWIEDGRKKRNYRRFASEAEYLYDELMKYIEEYPELNDQYT